MAWVRLDDNFHWHPKVAPLSDAAYRLYVGALCYSNRYELGGQIELADATTVCGRRGRQLQRLADELVATGLWVVEDHGWVIHDYLLYQPDPAKQAAGRAGGLARAQADRKQKSSKGQAEPQAPAEAPAQAPYPSRTRPVGVENPSVGSPPLDEPLAIRSRGWRGGEESIGAVLQRFQRPEVVVS